MGATAAKRYSSHKSSLKFLKILLNFCFQYPHKFTFFFVFLKIGPYGGKLRKKATPLKHFMNVCLQHTQKVTFSDFLNFVRFKFYETLKFHMGVNGKS